jgi:glutamate dehydrogenase
VERLERAAATPDRLVTGLERMAGRPAHTVQFKIYRRDRPIPDLRRAADHREPGVAADQRRPYEIDVAGGSWWIQDFELEHPRGVSIDLATDGPRLQATFDAVWNGHADNDGFNRLVLAADLDWREVTVLRTYARWFVQLGLPLSQTYMEEALATNPAAAGHLARLFLARFDPDLKPSARTRAESRHREALDALLGQISRVDDDRIVRAFLSAVLATLRTNFFRTDAAGTPRSYLSLKLEPRAVPEAPLPRPMFEIFVHSPRFEGVHLRMGKVARGGLRWSDRREDFRTEILGLMKAQNVKNTVIVPVGSKGGFVPRRLPRAATRRSPRAPSATASSSARSST